MEIILLLLRKSYQSTLPNMLSQLDCPAPDLGYFWLTASEGRLTSFTIEVLELYFRVLFLIKSMAPTALRPRLSMHQLPTQDTYFYHHHANPRRTP
jgi:hypothetical protein